MTRSIGFIFALFLAWHAPLSAGEGSLFPVLDECVIYALLLLVLALVVCHFRMLLSPARIGRVIEILPAGGCLPSQGEAACGMMVLVQTAGAEPVSARVNSCSACHGGLAVGDTVGLSKVGSTWVAYRRRPPQ